MEPTGSRGDDFEREELFAGTTGSDGASDVPMKRPLLTVCRDFVYRRLPFAKWFPEYRISQDLPGDFAGGLTIGIMHIAEGMAYAPLAGVRPVNGLFSCLFPALFYMLFGTSRHVSVGGFAVICLMTGSATTRATEQLMAGMNVTAADEPKIRENLAIQITAALTMFIGFVQILLGICRLYKLTPFLSDQVIAGFTTGAAVHVMTSQLDKALGASIGSHNGLGKLFFIYRDIVAALSQGRFHLITACIGCFVVFCLFFIKNWIDPKLRSWLNIQKPLPYDLFVMVLATFFSSYFALHAKYGVAIIEDIPTGLPSAKLPELGLFPLLALDSVSIGIIILVIHLSMGKLFAKKHTYPLDMEQEFYATGLTEVLCSFFPVYPPSTSLGRSLVGESAGTRTQLSAVFSSSLVLCVILFLGPLLEPLPTCVLAAIVIVSLQGMFRQLGQVPQLWRVNRIDSAVFMVTFLATVLVGIVPGLCIGVIFVLGTVIFRSKKAKLTCEVETAPKQCPTRADCQLVLTFTSPLIFLNVEQFWRNLRKLLDRAASEKAPHSIVFDLHLVTNIDTMGGNAIIEVHDYCQKHGYIVHFCRANEKVLRLLNRMEQFERISTAFC
ncbi:unnamed protein product, partial [Mesorhabditis spiculigera]